MRVVAALSLIAIVLVPDPAAAQARGGQGFVSVSVGAQRAASSRSETFDYEVYVERGSIEVDYPGTTALAFDVTAGRLLRGRWGLAIGAGRTTASGAAPLSAQVPHPLFDNRHRAVEGEARGVSRTETALHVQVYYEPRSTGRTRLRVFGGPSFFSVGQEIVETIEVDETYPFDTATFRSAQTVRASRSGPGMNAGVEASRMLSRRLGAGLVVRYALAALDLNAPNSRTVTGDGGGIQVGGAVRVIVW